MQDQPIWPAPRPESPGLWPLETRLAITQDRLGTIARRIARAADKATQAAARGDAYRADWWVRLGDHLVEALHLALADQAEATRELVETRHSLIPAQAALDVVRAGLEALDEDEGHFCESPSCIQFPGCAAYRYDSRANGYWGPGEEDQERAAWDLWEAEFERMRGES